MTRFYAIYGLQGSVALGPRALHSTWRAEIVTAQASDSGSLSVSSLWSFQNFCPHL